MNIHFSSKVISSCQEIHEDRFNTYTWETAELFVKLYGWYRMPPSVHKLLVHGSEAVKHAIVPIGQLSEEAQECRNKDYRRFKEHHTRKTSRLDTTKDIFNMLLISSDPVIASLRSKSKKSHREFSPEALELLRIT